jgi:hypothetical protein
VERSTGGAGTYLVRGAQGKNNTTTPNTQYDLDANKVQPFNPSDGSIVVRQNPSVLTNNILTAGPAAGGRDQAGAFSASSWIHFYWIWNGTTLSTISSLSAPTGAAGPTMPATYTHWAYAGAIRLDASNALISTYVLGSWVYYVSPTEVLSAGAATVTAYLHCCHLYQPAGHSPHGWHGDDGDDHHVPQCNANPLLRSERSAPTRSAYITVMGYSVPNGGE